MRNLLEPADKTFYIRISLSSVMIIVKTAMLDELGNLMFVSVVSFELEMSLSMMAHSLSICQREQLLKLRLFNAIYIMLCVLRLLRPYGSLAVYDDVPATLLSDTLASRQGLRLRRCKMLNMMSCLRPYIGQLCT